MEKNKLTGNYTGYYVDLMNEISKLGEFNYTFKETLITRTSYTEKPESLIEEFNQRSLHVSIMFPWSDRRRACAKY